MSFPYKMTRLPSGIRVASIEMPHMRSVSVGFWAAVGGRHETKAQAGISHFIEHLLFKGTETRTPRQIIEAVEGVGGYLNAFTTEDHTCYYAKAAAPHLRGLCTVLCDMYQHATMSPVEINREREVIKEEILMYRDQPSQHAEELLAETMWPGQPLGRPLTGTLASISGFQRDDLREFQRRYYNAGATTVTVAGNVRHAEVVDYLAESLENLPKGRAPRGPKAVEPRGNKPVVAAVAQDTEQAHLAMGFHAFGRNDERRFALKILSILLGENMSSRLFQQLRERHGFCYSVQSSIATFQDTGVLDICAGLDPAKLDRALIVIMREIDRFCDRAPTAAQLRRAQDYAVGQTCMGLESTSNQMMWMGESILSHGRVLDPEDVEQRLLAVTREEVREVAQTCLNRSRMAVAIVGPVRDPASIAALVS